MSAILSRPECVNIVIFQLFVWGNNQDYQPNLFTVPNIRCDRFSQVSFFYPISMTIFESGQDMKSCLITVHFTRHATSLNPISEDSSGHRSGNHCSSANGLVSSIYLQKQDPEST